MTKQDKLKYIRAYCKAQGVTFKRSKIYIGNALSWQVVRRKPNEVIADRLTIDEAYNRFFD